MAGNHLPPWKRTPMLRLFIPFAAGIAWQQQYGTALKCWYILFCTALICSAACQFFSVYFRYRWQWISGICIHLLFFAAGALLFTIHDAPRAALYWANAYRPGDGLLISPDETPREKKNTWSVTASVHYIIRSEKAKAVDGKILLYFEKDSAGKVAAPGPVRPGSGSFLLTKSDPQPLLISGNPGGFDFRHYAYTKGITHQLFIKKTGYVILPRNKKNRINEWIENIRQWVLSVFRRYISDTEDRGLAEALLIGYKDDLDKDLVRSYSNTGVVHIIAISGLHLGLIYGILVLLCKPIRRLKLLRAAVIISGLWLFSILAGAQPSVLRSALMFSCLVMGEMIDRRGTAINSLVFSAFLLLCINPWWLWDAGFLLSYTAVLSIMLYQRPLYHLLYIKNKLSDFIWQLNTVTLAAQLLTFPVSVYFFHQFPVYFMLTNLLAVPLSSLIVLAEILLLAVAGIPILGHWTGILISALIRFMNTWIRNMEWMPYSAWSGLQIGFVQAVCLLFIIVFTAYGLKESKKAGLYISLLCLLLFGILRTCHFRLVQQQQLFIVYNTPRRQVIEFISGRNAVLFGDPLQPDTAGIFPSYLRPAHTLYRIRLFTDSTARDAGLLLHCGKCTIFLPGNDDLLPPTGMPLSILVLSRNNRWLPDKGKTGLVIADGTLSGKGLQALREKCIRLGIPFYSVREQGAFVMNLP